VTEEYADELIAELESELFQPKTKFILNGRNLDGYSPISGCDVRARLPLECRDYLLRFTKDDSIVTDLTEISDGSEIYSIPPHGFKFKHNTERNK